MLVFVLCRVLGLTVVLLMIEPFISFWRDRKSLRSFPSPKGASLSSLWRIWHNLHKRHYWAVHQAHKEFGSHVRIAPNHISVLDQQAVTDIYGHGSSMMKDAWYDAGAGMHRNLPDARDKQQHQAKRKMLAHAFAQKTIVSLEPLLQQTISEFLIAIDSFVTSQQPINMRMYLNYFTIDLFGRILYSTNMNCMSRGSDLVDAETVQGTIYKTHFIQSLLDATVLNTVLAMEPSLLAFTKPLFKPCRYSKAGQHFEDIIRYYTKRRFDKGTSENDLFTRLIQDSKGNMLNLPLGEIAAECNSMMNAGTETTTAAMTNTIFLVFTHPEVLERLRAEIDPHFDQSGRTAYDKVANLPYLRACIEESLRVRPASSMGLPRVVPQGGRVIAGKFVAEGVVVSVPTYSLLRDGNVFDRASEYVPERWLDSDAEAKRQMMKSHLPFSTGPRACIGRNIAYFEQTLVIASLVHLFDLEVPAGFQLQTLERFNSNPGDLFMHCRRRAGRL